MPVRFRPRAPNLNTYINKYILINFIKYLTFIFINVIYYVNKIKYILFKLDALILYAESGRLGKVEQVA